MIIHKVGGKEVAPRELIVRDLRESNDVESDIAKIISFQKNVVVNIPLKEIYAFDTEEELRSGLEDNSMILKMLYDNEKFVGFYVLLINNKDANAYYQVSEKDAKDTLILHGIVIDPDYWGNRLHLQRIIEAKQIATKLGLNTLICTTAPNNKYGFPRLRQEGFYVVTELYKAAGRRNLMRCNLPDLPFRMPPQSRFQIGIYNIS